MAYVETFTVGNATYNAVMASAVKQDELLSLLSVTILDRALAAAAGGSELGDDVLVPMLLSLPYDIKSRVTGILMHKVVLHGGQTPVGVDSFQGRMIEYNTLLAQLLRWNLSDFFTWLDSALKSARPAPPVNPAQ